MRLAALVLSGGMPCTTNILLYHSHSLVYSNTRRLILLNREHGRLGMRSEPIRGSTLYTGFISQCKQIHTVSVFQCNAMITFTPLSGAAHSSNATPLAYLLQVDDVRILLDCGSPDWTPEPSPFEEHSENESGDVPWAKYCEALQKCVNNSPYCMLRLEFTI